MALRDGFVSLLVGLTACAGVSPRPELANAADLPMSQATSEDRARLPAVLEQAMEAAVSRRFEDARAAANEALAIDPRSARARAVLAMVHLQRAAETSPHDLHSANAGEVEMRLAQQLAPDDAFVGWMAAVFLYDSGHTSAAAAAAEQALARAGDRPTAERAALLFIAGIYRYELGEERAALPHLQAYVALRPDDATSHFRLGSCLLRIAAVPKGIQNSLLDAQRTAESAARAFARCAELSPGDEDAALAVAIALWRATQLAIEGADAGRDQNLNAATAQLRAVADRFPTSAMPWFQLGVIAEATAAPVQARTAYEAALQRDPRHVPTMLNFAALLATSDQRDASITLWKQVLAADAAQPSLTPRERQRLRELIGS